MPEVELRPDLLAACVPGQPNAAQARAVLHDWLAERGSPAAEALPAALAEPDLELVGFERPGAWTVAVFRLRDRLAFLDLEEGERAFDLELVLLPPLESNGDFVIGSVDEGDANPRRTVRIEPILVARTPITQRVYNDGGRRVYAKHPVTHVAWAEAMHWCGSRRLRLPTEVEWEVAARGGTHTEFCFGDRLPPGRANVDGERTTPVGSYPVNAFGLYDVHGNVGEWCADAVADYNRGRERAVRGGSWMEPATFARSGARHSADQGRRADDIGFRPVRSVRRVTVPRLLCVVEDTVLVRDRGTIVIPGPSGPTPARVVVRGRGREATYDVRPGETDDAAGPGEPRAILVVAPEGAIAPGDELWSAPE